MKETYKKPYLILLAVALIFTLVMVFAACSGDDSTSETETDTTASPAADRAVPTMEPGQDMALTLEAPSSFTPGETVTYFVRLTDCSVAEGLIGLDFSLNYDSSVLQFETCRYTGFPSDTWEGAVRQDGDSTLIFTAYDDTFDDYTPITGAGQFTAEVDFTVSDSADSQMPAVSLADISGAKNDESISMAYGYAADQP